MSSDADSSEGAHRSAGPAVTTSRAAPLILVAVLAMVLLAGCFPGPQGMASEGEAVGLVTDVQGSGPADVDRFTLRTDEGRLLTLRVDPARLSPDSFAPAHLREHLASGAKVLVRYEGVGDEIFVTRLTDAP
jgi:hypothetical protein